MATTKRDLAGKLLPGSTANPGKPKGRPPKVVEETYLQAFTEVVTLPEMRQIIRTALRQAKKGDKDARKWLTDYIVGPPVQRVLDPALVVNPYAGMSAEELKATAQAVLRKVKLRMS